ncbi:GNAT family N-acetyltransferase [Arthrobacter pigmenti]
MEILHGTFISSRTVPQLPHIAPVLRNTLNGFMTNRSGFAEFDPTFVRNDQPKRSLIVRAALLNDVESITAVEKISGRPVVDRSVFEEAIGDKNRLVVVAATQDEVIGWAKTHHFGEPGHRAPAGHYLGGVTVVPEFRRTGVGSMLTEARLDWIWSRSSEAWYTVNAKNLVSIQLHQKWGFREVARGPKFHSTVFRGVGVLFCAPRPGD